MFSFKTLLCFTALNQLCLAMSFTARYESVSSSTASPVPVPQAMHEQLRGDQTVVVNSLTAATSIQINGPKPRHIERMQTVLENITLLASSVRLKWKFVVITKNRIKRLSTRASVERARRSLEWVIKVRQYGTLNVNLYHVRDEKNSIDDFLVHNQTYNYTIKGLHPLTAYEVCLHSNHGITDAINSVVNSYQRPNDICKEIVTSDASGVRVVEITMASAISSASTTVIIVVMFCCCRKSNDRSDGSQRGKSIASSRQNRRKRFKYHRMWRWMDRSPAERSLMSSSLMSAVPVNRPVLNPVMGETHEFYINPEDIKCISAKNVRVFTKNAYKLNSAYVPKVRNNISTTSMFRRRYRRPVSWPLIEDRTWLKTQSNPNISAKSAETTTASKLWFHSSEHNISKSDKTFV